MIYIVCKGVRNYNGVPTSTTKFMKFGSINGQKLDLHSADPSFFDNFDT